MYNIKRDRKVVNSFLKLTSVCSSLIFLVIISQLLDSNIYASQLRVTERMQTDNAITTVDIMIVYTQATRQALGGQQATVDLARQAVDATNLAYKNSLVDAKLRLVHTEEIDYTETNNAGIELDRLSKPSDGFMDEVQNLRDKFGADLVSLLISYGDGGVSGLLQSSTIEQPYSVVSYKVAASRYVLAHEIGHNMGLCHDAANTSPDSACLRSDYWLPYAKGYQDPDGLFRDVMGPPPNQCPIQNGCIKILYFSNPEVKYNGKPTGIANIADCARALRITAPIAASWRPTKVREIYLPVIINKA